VDSSEAGKANMASILLHCLWAPLLLLHHLLF